MKKPTGTGDFCREWNEEKYPFHEHRISERWVASYQTSVKKNRRRTQAMKSWTTWGEGVRTVTVKLAGCHTGMGEEEEYGTVWGKSLRAVSGNLRGGYKKLLNVGKRKTCGRRQILKICKEEGGKGRT